MIAQCATGYSKFLRGLCKPQERSPMQQSKVLIL